MCSHFYTFYENNIFTSISIYKKILFYVCLVVWCYSIPDELRLLPQLVSRIQVISSYTATTRHQHLNRDTYCSTVAVGLFCFESKSNPLDVNGSECVKHTISQRYLIEASLFSYWTNFFWIHTGENFCTALYKMVKQHLKKLLYSVVLYLSKNVPF